MSPMGRGLADSVVPEMAVQGPTKATVYDPVASLLSKHSFHL